MITISYDETEHPEQPDGIETDSNDLPDPREAAKRINSYVSEVGDGLYDNANGKPLYARDLEAITRAVLRSELSVDRSTPYRLSPAGTLAVRTSAFVWRVVHAPDRRHHFGQQLDDQHLAAWSPLVRRGGASA